MEYTNTEEKRRIYDSLRAHPKSARELEKIAKSTPGESHSDSLRRAQEVIVDFVLNRYGGNTPQFLEDYDSGKIRPAHIILEAGRHYLRTNFGFEFETKF